MKKKTVKKPIIYSCIAVLAAAVLALSGLGFYFGFKKKDPPPAVVNPIEWSTDVWDGETSNSAGWVNGESFANRGSKSYTIDSVESFIYFTEIVNNDATAKQYNYFKEYTIYLNKNIDAAGYAINPIGTRVEKTVANIAGGTTTEYYSTFQGIFDGSYYTIYNAEINGDGLFGYIENATIQNIGLYNCNVRGDKYAGGIAGEAINTDIINTYVRGGVIMGDNAGGLVGRYVSNNGTHKIENSFADTTLAGEITAGLVADLDTNMSSENTVSISNSYYTMDGNAYLSSAAPFVSPYEVFKATSKSQFTAEEWNYSPEYNLESTWCDYSFIKNSQELDFNYPILTKFNKVFMTGSCYENVVKNETTGEIINASTIAEAFASADDTAELDVNIIVEKVFLDTTAVIDGEAEVTLNTIVDTTIVRAGEEAVNMIVGAEDSTLILGNEGATATHNEETGLYERNEDLPTMVLDGEMDKVEAEGLTTGALVYAQGADFKMYSNVRLQNNINNTSDNSYGGGLYLNLTAESEDDLVTISGGEVDNCHAAAGGGIAVIGYCDITVDNMNVTNCSGSGLYIAQEIEDGNTVEQAMYSKYAGDRVVTRPMASGKTYTLTATSSSSYSGNNGTSKTIDPYTSTISQQFGGGILLFTTYGNATLTLSGGTIKNNTASIGGGVAATDNDGSQDADVVVSLTGATIASNTASGGMGLGAGVAVRGTFKMTGGYIQSNTASYYGGGIHRQNSSSNKYGITNQTAVNGYGTYSISNMASRISGNSVGSSGAGKNTYGCGSGTIKFYGNSSSSSTVSSNQTVYMYDYATSYTPSRSGYTFYGWATSSSSTTSSVSSATSARYTGTNLNYYAIWKRTISIDAIYTYNEDGTSATSTSAANTAYCALTGSISTISVTMPAAVSRPGYTFYNWSTSSTISTGSTAPSGYTAGSSTSFSVSAASTSKTLYATFKRTVTLTGYYSPNADGSGPLTTSSTTTAYTSYNGTITTMSIAGLTSPSRTGYTFYGWTSASSYAQSATAPSIASFPQLRTVSANQTTLTYYATFSRSVTVTGYGTTDAAGTTTSSTTATTTNYVGYTGTITSITATMPSSVSRTGYYQYGWSTSSSIAQTATAPSNTTSVSVSAASTSATRYAVYYRQLRITGNYSTDDAGTTTSTVSKTTYNYVGYTGTIAQISATMPAAQTRTGYNFSKWSTSSSIAQTSTAPSGYTANTAYTYNVSSAASSSTMYAVYYRYVRYIGNYSTDDAGTTTYTVTNATYNYVGYTGTISTITAILPSAPTARTGYTFYKWYANTSYTQSSTAPSTNVYAAGGTRSITVTAAVTTQNVYATYSRSVTINGGYTTNEEGNILDVKTATTTNYVGYTGTISSITATTPEAGVREDYTFYKWYTGSSYSQSSSAPSGYAASSTTSVSVGAASTTKTWYATYSRSVIINGIYTKNADGSGPDTKAVTTVNYVGYNGKITSISAGTPVAGSRTGYTFYNWHTATSYAQSATAPSGYAASSTTTVSTDVASKTLTLHATFYRDAYIIGKYGSSQTYGASVRNYCGSTNTITTINATAPVTPQPPQGLYQMGWSTSANQPTSGQTECPEGSTYEGDIYPITCTAATNTVTLYAVYEHEWEWAYANSEDDTCIYNYTYTYYPYNVDCSILYYQSYTPPQINGDWTFAGWVDWCNEFDVTPKMSVPWMNNGDWTSYVAIYYRNDGSHTGTKTLTHTFYTGEGETFTVTSLVTYTYNNDKLLLCGECGTIHNTENDTTANATSGGALAYQAKSSSNFTLVGWNTNKSATATWTSGNQNPTTAQTYYAVWRKTWNFYTTSASTAAQTETMDCVYNVSTTQSMTYTPSATGYNFYGWSAANDNTAEVVGSTQSLSAASGNFYAVWRKSWTIYTDQESTVDVSYKCSDAADANKSYTVPNASIAGYTLVGYSAAKDFTAEFKAGATSTTVTSSSVDPAIYAVWSRVESGTDNMANDDYAVTFLTGSGTMNPSVYTGKIYNKCDYTRTATYTHDLSEVSYGAKSYGDIYESSRDTLNIVCPVATRSGYGFAGWSTNSDNTVEWSEGSKTFNSGATYYAVWYREAQVVGNYATDASGNKATVIGSKQTVYGAYTDTISSISCAMPVSIAGYEIGDYVALDGWSLDAQGLEATNNNYPVSCSGVTSIKNVYAVWSRIFSDVEQDYTSDNISVTFNANGATGTQNAISYKRYYQRDVHKEYRYNYDLSLNTILNTTYSNEHVSRYETITLPSCTFSNTGYKLVAWALGSVSGTRYNVGATYNGEAVVFYAIWAPITYTISYDLNDGSDATAINATYNVAVNIATPTRYNHVFLGWTSSNINRNTAKHGLNSASDSWDGSYSMSTYFMNLSTVDGQEVVLVANWQEEITVTINVQGPSTTSAYGIVIDGTSYSETRPFTSDELSSAYAYVTTGDNVIASIYKDEVSVDTLIGTVAAHSTKEFISTEAGNAWFDGYNDVALIFVFKAAYKLEIKADTAQTGAYELVVSDRSDLIKTDDAITSTTAYVSADTTLILNIDESKLSLGNQVFVGFIYTTVSGETGSVLDTGDDVISYNASAGNYTINEQLSNIEIYVKEVVSNVTVNTSAFTGEVTIQNEDGFVMNINAHTTSVFAGTWTVTSGAIINENDLFSVTGGTVSHDIVDGKHTYTFAQ